MCKMSNINSDFEPKYMPNLNNQQICISSDIKKMKNMKNIEIEEINNSMQTNQILKKINENKYIHHIRSIYVFMGLIR